MDEYESLSKKVDALPNLSSALSIVKAARTTTLIQIRW